MSMCKLEDLKVMDVFFKNKVLHELPSLLERSVVSGEYWRRIKNCGALF